MNKFDNEQNFILDVLRGLAKNNFLSVTFRNNAFSQLNWPRIIKISSEQKVLGFISYAAHEQGWIPALSPGIQKTLANALMTYRFSYEEKKMQFKRINTLLEHEGIVVIPLKGIYLSSFIYEDMPYRSMDDIDILVSKDHVEKVVKILEKEGFAQPVYPIRYRWHTQIIQKNFECDDSYRKRLGRIDFVHPNGLYVDLHWEPFYIVGNEQITFDSNYFWKSTTPGVSFEKNVYLMAPLRHLLFLTTHTEDQYKPNLVQLFEIALSMQKIPKALSCLEEVMKDWPSLAKERIFHLCSTAQNIFFSETPTSNLSNDAVKLLLDFFIKEGKKERHNPYPLILTTQQKVIFILGYFIPEPSFYLENNQWRMYKDHWSFLIKRLIKILKRKSLHVVSPLQYFVSG